MSLIATRHTDERFAIRNLIDLRVNGLSLLRGFFVGLTQTSHNGETVIQEPISVTESDLMLVYTGQPIEADKWELIKRVLRERLPKET